jgi:hypothetical protein
MSIERGRLRSAVATNYVLERERLAVRADMLSAFIAKCPKAADDDGLGTGFFFNVIDGNDQPPSILWSLVGISPILFQTNETMTARRVQHAMDCPASATTGHLTDLS